MTEILAWDTSRDHHTVLPKQDDTDFDFDAFISHCFLFVFVNEAVLFLCNESYTR